MKKLLLVITLLVVWVATPLTASAQEFTKKSSIFVGWSYEEKKSDLGFGFAKDFMAVKGLTLTALGAVDPSNDGSGNLNAAVTTDLTPWLDVGVVFGVGFDAQTKLGTDPDLQQLVEAAIAYGASNVGYMVTVDISSIVGAPIAMAGALKRHFAFDSESLHETYNDYYVFAAWQFGQ